MLNQTILREQNPSQFGQTSVYSQLHHTEMEERLVLVSFAQFQILLGNISAVLDTTDKSKLSSLLLLSSSLFYLHWKLFLMPSFLQIKL